MKDTVDMLVTALCADYARRAELIGKPYVSKRAEMELRYINSKICTAVLEIAPENEVEAYISEIGFGIGYAKSEIYSVSEVNYKKKKKRIKDNIAKKLYLLG